MYALSIVFPTTHSETAMMVCTHLESTRGEDCAPEAILGSTASLRLEQYEG